MMMIMVSGVTEEDIQHHLWLHVLVWGDTHAHTHTSKENSGFMEDWWKRVGAFEKGFS